ncbi:MAG: hypothetical protein M3340_14050 [Actinomycetota bacterium]|nr:hypothetical protein [Actinomycetota bacterium]
MVRLGVLRGAAAALAATTLAFGACDGGGDDGGDAPGPGEEVGVAQEFPVPPAGSSLADLRRGLGPGPLMATSVSVLQPGRNRFAFALFDRTRRQIGDTPAAVYVAPAVGGAVEGPYRARYQSLEVADRHRSETVQRDGDAARSIYVADIPFRGEGEYEVLGVTQLDQRVVGGTPVKVSVGYSRRPPTVGQAVPRVHTPTADEVGSLAEIDTREPPSTMHEDDLADVLGRRPVMLLFATPRLCRSRVCGPVVDVMEQVKSERPAGAAYIHMEIWNGNSRDQGQRPQVRAFGLPSEPWLFAIDARGRVAARIEGAFGVREAEAALRKAVGR